LATQNHHPDPSALVSLRGLSPHLFSVYINDMPTVPKAKIALYADDTMFYATSYNNSNSIKILQSQVYIAIEWFRQWKMTINPMIDIQ